MHLSKRKKGFLCVASPDFENSSSFSVDIIIVSYSPTIVKQEMKDAEMFWKKFVYKKLFVV